METMFKLTRRKGSAKWQVRKRWPSDVAEVLKGEFNVSTGEEDRKAAQQCLPLISAEYERRLAEARAKLAEQPQSEISEAEAHRMAADFYRLTLPSYIVKRPIEPPRWSGSSKKAVRPVFRLLRDMFFGRDAGSITREEARDIGQLLQGLPTVLGKQRELAELPIREAVAKAREMALPTISPKTLNDGYLMHIASVFSWARKEQWVTSNPFEGL